VWLYVYKEGNQKIRVLTSPNAAQHARNAFAQHLDALEVLRLFSTLKDDLNHLTAIFRGKRQDVRASLDGEYHGLIGQVTDTINEAANHRFWNLEDIGETCGTIKGLLGILSSPRYDLTTANLTCGPGRTS
jgi:hypothetical protein